MACASTACASELRLHLLRLLVVIVARLPERGSNVATSAYVTMPRVTATQALLPGGVQLPRRLQGRQVRVPSGLEGRVVRHTRVPERLLRPWSVLLERVVPVCASVRLCSLWGFSSPMSVGVGRSGSAPSCAGLCVCRVLPPVDTAR